MASQDEHVVEEDEGETTIYFGCVPSAGIAIDKPFIDQTWDEFTRIQEINVRDLLSDLIYRKIY